MKQGIFVSTSSSRLLKGRTRRGLIRIAFRLERYTVEMMRANRSHMPTTACCLNPRGTRVEAGEREQGVIEALKQLVGEEKD